MSGNIAATANIAIGYQFAMQDVKGCCRFAVPVRWDFCGNAASTQKAIRYGDGRRTHKNKAGGA